MQNINPDPLGTPVYLKTGANDAWPRDKFFYILSREGLRLCRNHLWFESCAAATKGPGELAEQKEFLHAGLSEDTPGPVREGRGFFRRHPR